jgi:hypothetical protein
MTGGEVERNRRPRTAYTLSNPILGQAVVMARPIRVEVVRVLLAPRYPGRRWPGPGGRCIQGGGEGFSKVVVLRLSANRT